MIDRIHKQMGNFIREMETEKESNVLSKMKNSFNRFILRLGQLKK